MKFHLVLIKPTHYDDDGYPITWLRSHIPSNTLAALYGLGEDCRQRAIFGPEVDIVIKPFDETNTRVRPEKIAASIAREGGKALMLIGIARELTDLGCSYDLYTRTTTANHYAVVQELFTTIHRNGYMVEETTRGAISFR